MALHRMADLNDWKLEDKDQDIRERPLVDADGKTLGIIKDLAVDLEAKHVTAVVTDMGESYAVEDLDIEPNRVITRQPPISGGTSEGEARSLRGEGYVVRIIQIT
jgi:sporulation protein YlmC with PRC-barrel domain